MHCCTQQDDGKHEGLQNSKDPVFLCVILTAMHFSRKRAFSLECGVHLQLMETIYKQRTGIIIAINSTIIIMTRIGDLNNNVQKCNFIHGFQNPKCLFIKSKIFSIRDFLGSSAMNMAIKAGSCKASLRTAPIASSLQASIQPFQK